MLRLGAASGFALLLATVSAYAVWTTYLLSMDGAQNISTSELTGGAVRGQLGTVAAEPPAPAQLIGLGALALGVMSRRKAH